LTFEFIYDILKRGTMRENGAARPGRRRRKKEDSKVLFPPVFGVALEVLLGGESMRLAIGVKPHGEFLRGHLVVGLLEIGVFLLLSHLLALLTLLL
jgi:hypothetical protein